ncbi:MAG: universal stress protein [Deltaproteobacteria bacterium]|nr:universal stress protein [Deltaproteobacteria bacterium]MBW1993987.1 universal stress protein [Deltaproteobacteria bacterium]MBW2153014.1 universal stress protein [Deltaproteobacteria bacterium]
MKILVGYDGSNTAKDALKLAKLHAKAFDAKVFVVMCLSQPREIKPKDMDKMEEADRELNDIKDRFDADGIACDSRLSVHDMSPGESLVQFAADHEIDEIFIGVRRRSKVGKLVFGSTAQYVILEAPCPVVTVK